MRAVKAASGKEASFSFVCQETYPPYALSVVGLAPDSMTIAEKKIMYAMDVWRTCLEEDEWPGYPNRTCFIDLPMWVEEQWLRHETEDK